jgi:hypothetical protein
MIAEEPIKAHHDRIGSGNQRREHERDQDEAGKPSPISAAKPRQRATATTRRRRPTHDQQRDTPLEVRELVLGGWSADGGMRTSLMTWPALIPDE